MEEMVIDATDAVLGRLASFIAKKALLGNKIIILNSEKAVINGGKKDILDTYKVKRARGNIKGPFFPSSPTGILKRTVRGMLSHKKGRGSTALKRVIAFESVPEKYANAESTKIDSRKGVNFLTLGELSKLL